MSDVIELTPECDFFISYTKSDQPWAEWIAWTLEENKYKVLIQAWDFVPGTNWISKMNEGVANAARTIAVLSPAYLTSLYGKAEWQAAWAADPEGVERKLLVVRVAECERRGLLAGVVSIDLFDMAEAAARAELRRKVAEAVRGDARPETRPRFPGIRTITREPKFPSALPSIWNMPGRNPNFTGRVAELRKLNHALTTGPSIAVVPVRGLAGVGKSELVTQYAYDHAREYDLVWTISAEKPAIISDEFERLASQLGLGRLPDTEELRYQINAILRETAGWLLIFDNADTVEHVEPWIPSGLMPARIPGHVLVTTQRRTGFGDLGRRPVDLEVMKLTDAVRLLSVLVPQIPKDTAREIAETLGQLPIALEHAAAHMDTDGIDGPAYLALLRRPSAGRHDMEWVLDRKDGRHRGIAIPWDINLEIISSESTAAIQLMDLCAYLAPEPIPLDLFTAHLELLPEPLASVAADALEFSDVIGILFNYSLVKRLPAHLQVHRLVQGAVRRRHEVPDPAASIRSRAEELLAASNPGAPENPATWPRWAEILPHLLAAELAPTKIAGLRSAACDACRYMLARGDHQGCADLTKIVYEPWRERFGDDDKDALTIAIYRARALADLGPIAPAKQIADRTLAVLRTKLGEGHPLTLTAASDLAGYLRVMGDTDGALRLDEDTYSCRKRILGEDAPDTLTSAANLASDMNLVGLARAASLFDAADEPSAAYDTDEFIAAYELDYDTLARRRRVLGPDHPDTLDSASNTASDLIQLGRLAEALELSRDTVDRRRRVQGPNHPATLRASVNLAADLALHGEIEAAKKLADDAYKRIKRLKGEDHETTLGCEINIAGIHDVSGDTLAAKEMAERTLSRCRHRLGSDNPTTRACERDLDSYVTKLRTSG